jgi:hypothetical protein
MRLHNATSADDRWDHHDEVDTGALDDAVLQFFRAEGTHRASGEVQRVAHAMTKAVADADAADAGRSEPNE